MKRHTQCPASQSTFGYIVGDIAVKERKIQALKYISNNSNEYLKVVDATLILKYYFDIHLDSVARIFGISKIFKTLPIYQKDKFKSYNLIEPLNIFDGFLSEMINGFTDKDGLIPIEIGDKYFKKSDFVEFFNKEDFNISYNTIEHFLKYGDFDNYIEPESNHSDRTDIEQLKKENAELKARIAELEKESIKDSAYILIARSFEVFKKYKNNATQETYIEELRNDETIKKHGFGHTTIKNIFSKANAKLADFRKK